MNYLEQYIRSEEDIKICPKIKEIIESAGFGKYIKPFSSIRKNSKEISYNQVLGKHIENLTLKLIEFRKQEKTIHREELIVSKDSKEITQTALELHEILLDKKLKGSKVERKLVFTGTSLPIKINFLQEDMITETIYAKKPDTNRLIGWFLYNLIQELPSVKFGFNEKLFLEQEVKGYTLQQEDDEVLLVVPEYRRGIGRAAAQAEFLGLFDDVLKERNRIIDFQYNTRLFDFDSIFEPLSQLDRGNHIMMHYANKQKIDLVMVDAYRNEKRNIAEKIKKHKGIILPFAEHANRLKDQGYGTIKQKIQEYSGHNGLKEYIVSQARKFSQ